MWTDLLPHLAEHPLVGGLSSTASPYVEIAGSLTGLASPQLMSRTRVGLGATHLRLVWPTARLVAEWTVRELAGVRQTHSSAVELRGELLNVGEQTVRLSRIEPLALTWQTPKPQSALPTVVMTARADASDGNAGRFPPRFMATESLTLLAGEDRLAEVVIGSEHGDLPYLRATTADGRWGMMAGVEAQAPWRMSLAIWQTAGGIAPGDVAGVSGRGCRGRLRGGWSRADVALPPGEALPLPTVLVGWCGSDTTELLSRSLRNLATTTRSAVRQTGAVVWSPFGLWGHGMTGPDVANRLPAAARCGCRGVVLDDGWAAGLPPTPGTSRDRAITAGVFEADAQRFAGGLAPLAQAAAKAGLTLGVGADIGRLHTHQALARRYPHWLVWPAGIDRTAYSGPLGLDYSQSEMRSWVRESLERLITQAGVGWLRLDAGSCGAARWGHPVTLTAARHVAGVYSVLDDLRGRHPELTLELGPNAGQWLGPRMWCVADLMRLADGPRHGDVHRRFVMGALDWLPADGLTAEMADFPDDNDPRWVVGLATGCVAVTGDIAAGEFARRVARLGVWHRSVSLVRGGRSLPLTGTPARPHDWEGRLFVADHPTTAHVPAGGDHWGTDVRQVQGLMGFVVGSRPAAAAQDCPAQGQTPREQTPPPRWPGLSAEATYRIVDGLAGNEMYRTGQMLADDGLRHAASAQDVEAPHLGPLLVVARVAT